MKTISLDDLDSVTGGKNLGISSGSSNDQLLSTLTNIQSSLKDLSKNQNQGGLFGGQNGLLFMTMALAMSQRQSNVVVYGGGCRRGFSWRVW